MTKTSRESVITITYLYTILSTVYRQTSRLTLRTYLLTCCLSSEYADTCSLRYGVDYCVLNRHPPQLRAVEHPRAAYLHPHFPDLAN